MKIKDKNKYLKNIDKKFKNSKIDKVENTIKTICYHYKIEYPEIINLKIDNNLEIKIRDYKYDNRIYTITISPISRKPILVSLTGKNYIESFELFNDHIMSIDKRIYQNNDKNIIIEKHMFIGENGNCYLIKKEKIDDNEEEIPYTGLLFYFKNDYLNGELSFAIPESHPFVEKLFVKQLLECNIEIPNIETLYCIVKSIINCNKINLKVENNTDKGKEIILVDNNKLKEYARITNDKKIEYKEGYKDLKVTKYETESIDNQEFQKALKMIRS